MKLRDLVALVVTLSGAFPSMVQAQWYVGADAGANFGQDTDVYASDGAADSSGNHTGYIAQLHAGYGFGAAAAELELAYRGRDVDSLADTDNVGGETSSLSFMLNGVYDFRPRAKWHPFVGAGLGVARVSATWSGHGQNAVTDSDWRLAYQTFAGVGYDVDKNWRLNAQYRYFATQDSEFASGAGHDIDVKNHNHAVMLGIRYAFTKSISNLPQAVQANQTAWAEPQPGRR